MADDPNNHQCRSRWNPLFHSPIRHSFFVSVKDPPPYLSPPTHTSLCKNVAEAFRSNAFPRPLTPINHFVPARPCSTTAFPGTTTRFGNHV